MSEEKMINDAALETIAGGTVRVVKNKSIGYATVRSEPSVKGSVIGKISNGTKVNTTGRMVWKDNLRWIEITFECGNGWVANKSLGN